MVRLKSEPSVLACCINPQLARPVVLLGCTRDVDHDGCGSISAAQAIAVAVEQFILFTRELCITTGAAGGIYWRPEPGSEVAGPAAGLLH